MAEINMIPLVDVMLVLLVAFIITAPVITHAVRVDLPQASASPGEPDEQSLFIAIDADGGLYWDSEAVSLGELEARLAASAAPGRELHLEADRAATYEVIARVMSAARQAGVRRIGFVTDPEAPR